MHACVFMNVCMRVHARKERKYQRPKERHREKALYTDLLLLLFFAVCVRIKAEHRRRQPIINLWVLCISCGHPIFCKHTQKSVILNWTIIVEGCDRKYKADIAFVLGSRFLLTCVCVSHANIANFLSATTASSTPSLQARLHPSMTTSIAMCSII